MKYLTTDDLAQQHFNALKMILYKKHGVELGQIEPGRTLENMGMDSLAVLELTFDIEDIFRVSFSYHDGLLLLTLQEVLSRIRGRQGGRAVA